MTTKKILLFEWASFMNAGIEKALNELNVPYDIFFYQFKDWETDPCFCQMFYDKLKNSLYSKVLSINFAPLISDICETFGIPYISWVYDSPVHIRNLKPMGNSCNTIFFFDREQANEYMHMGFPAKHLPLAADVELFQQAIAAGKHPLPMDISMVGQMYQTEYAHFAAPLNGYLKGYLDGIIKAQSKVYGGYIIPDLVSADLLKKMNAIYQTLSTEFQMGKRELEYMLACEVTGRERYLALALLSAHFPVSIYAKDPDTRLSNVTFCGYADYTTVLPKVFATSRINLNISLKTIRSGIPLRVIEAAGCGGFVLSNYQTELAEYFRIGEECEIYQNMEDLLQKADFYLHHEELRNKIACAGFERIKRDFTFESRINIMLK